MNPASPGPKVEDFEDLYRGITTPVWWIVEENRPSSAAFKNPDFSVDIASLAGSPTHTLAHLPLGSGIVSFNCGAAHAIGYEVRREPDPARPENHTHANVYNSSSTSQRKKMAQRLASQCTLVYPPSFVDVDLPGD